MIAHVYINLHTSVAKHYKSVILQGISVGKYHAGVLTNSDEAEAAVLKAGKISGDLNFPLPYSPELHFSEFNSVVADMKNSVAVGTCNVVPRI